MGPTLITRTARLQLDALDDDGRDAVDAAIGNLSEENGEPVELVGGTEGTTYLAMKASGDGMPVVIYRALPEDKGGGWLVLSLMSPDEYKDVIQLQEFLAGEPGARTLIELTTEALRSHTTVPSGHGAPSGQDYYISSRSRSTLTNAQQQVAKRKNA